MEVGCAHDLSKYLMIEMFFEDIEQRRAINFRQQGDVADDAHIAVMLDGAAIFNVFLADQHDAANRQARRAQAPRASEACD